MATRILTFGLPLLWQRATGAIKIFEASKLKRLITLTMSIKARLRFDHLDWFKCSLFIPFCTLSSSLYTQAMGSNLSRKLVPNILQV